MIGARLIAGAIAASVLSGSLAWADARKGNAWLPPGLSAEEQAEWKDGRPPGWTQGAKRGWGGRSCPPGQAKKGRCPDAVYVAATPGPTDPFTEALERLRRWGRQRGLPPLTVAGLLTGFEGAVRYGVPIASAERLVMIAADRGTPPHGIEVVTRAMAYSAQRKVPAREVEIFSEDALIGGVVANAIALGIYRLAAETTR